MEGASSSPSPILSPKRRLDESAPSPSGLLSPELESPELPPEGATGEEDNDAADEGMDPDLLTAQVESHVIAKENPLHGATDLGKADGRLWAGFVCRFFDFLDAFSHLYVRSCPSVSVYDKQRYESKLTLWLCSNPLRDASIFPIGLVRKSLMRGG